MLRLIGNYLRAGVMVDGVLQRTEEGTPQGGPASPLLANILLDDLDKELERRGLPFVRYADDFAIFAKSERSAQRIMASVTRYLADKLRLVVNQEKSRVVTCEEFEYLGFAFRKSRGTIQVSAKSSAIQAPHPRTDRPKSGHLDGASLVVCCEVTFADGWATSAWRRN